MKTTELALKEATIVEERRMPSPIEIRGGVQLTTQDEILSFCKIVANSKLAPKGMETPEALFVAVQMGLEIGLSPLQAVQNIAVINGRPSVWGDAALALVKGHPECDDVVESFEKDANGELAAVCEVHRRGKVPVKRKFTVAMAKKAGLWGKAGPWTTYSSRMLQMRARSWALRDAFPDALKGVGIAEEVRDIQEKPAMAREVPAMVLPDDPVEEPQKEEPSTAKDEKGEFKW